MSNQRDYNQELKDTADHKYAYNFDFDVMHPFMLKSFIPFFKAGNFLELGSFKGDFTKRFLPYFDDITWPIDLFGLYTQRFGAAQQKSLRQEVIAASAVGGNIVPLEAL